MLPIYIKGAREILPPLPKARPRLFDKKFKRLKTKIVFGNPIYPKAYDNEAELTSELKRQIVNLGKLTDSKSRQIREIKYSRLS